MGQNKMEKEFRRKLEAREIQPTENAWDRLDAMLTVAEKEKQKPVFKLNWLYIAAGFIGILLMATIVFKQSSKTALPENGVVIENKLPKAKPNDKRRQAPETFRQLQQTVAEKSNDAVQSTNKLEVAERNSIHQNASPIKKSDEAIAHSETEIKTPSEIVQKTTIKAPEVNVDELLASVDSKHKNFESPKVKVDAGSLLSQVDGEIELSFREKVIHTVSKNYKNVKVALANRNQE